VGRGANKVLIGAQQRKTMTDTSLSKQRVDRADLYSAATTLQDQTRGDDRITTFKNA
jgi:hypothetical protein